MRRVGPGIVALVLSACGTTPLGTAPVPVRLCITNPERRPLVLCEVASDEVRPVFGPFDAAATGLEVLPGAYALRVTAPRGAFALPVPAFDATLPPDRTLHLAIPRAPEGDDGDAEFAFVPAGPAVIGDTLGIGQPDERPARVVDVPAFWLGRHEVTNAEYAAFLAAVGPDVDPRWCAFDSRKFRIVRDPGRGTWHTDAPTLPVVTVSLAGAEAYCAWRTRVTGRTHRLPSEREWEKAARGPESFVFAYGNVYRPAAANQESGELRDVGGYAPNGYGLHDMTGNAFEWTADAYPGVAGAQVLRGGSFVLDGMYLRNSFRMRQDADVRTDDFGFRVARDLAPAENSELMR